MDNVISLEEMINIITDNVRVNMSYIHSEGEIETFRKFFEDVVLFEEIACLNSYYVKTIGNKNEISNNIKSALIASGISTDGLLKKQEKVESLKSKLDRDNLIFAKRRVIEKEKEYLNNDFGNAAIQLAVKVDFNKQIIDPSLLVKIGVCMQDRMSGYLEDNYKDNRFNISWAKKAWDAEKQKYIKEELTETVYFKILSDIFDNNMYNHYTLANRNALEKAASITYKIDNNISVDDNEFEELDRFNEASAVYGENVLEKYSIKINKLYRKNNQKIKVKKLFNK